LILHLVSVENSVAFVSWDPVVCGCVVDRSKVVVVATVEVVTADVVIATRHSLNLTKVSQACNQS